MSTQLVASVTGLTCQHCVQTVTSALESLPGVDGVAVDLVNGGESTVTFTRAGNDDILADIAQALASEGYSLTALQEANQ